MPTCIQEDDPVFGRGAPGSAYSFTPLLYEIFIFPALTWGRGHFSSFKQNRSELPRITNAPKATKPNRKLIISPERPSK